MIGQKLLGKAQKAKCNLFFLSVWCNFASTTCASFLFSPVVSRFFVRFCVKIARFPALAHGFVHSAHAPHARYWQHPRQTRLVCRRSSPVGSRLCGFGVAGGLRRHRRPPPRSHFAPLVQRGCRRRSRRSPCWRAPVGRHAASSPQPKWAVCAWPIARPTLLESIGWPLCWARAACNRRATCS